MNPTEIKYFLYARKSTESEDRQMASIPDQISEMQRVAEKMGLNIIEIISESRSAKQPGRGAFNAMLDRIYKGEANGILCWKLNRLARNPIDGGQISWMLQNGVIQHIQTNSQGFKPTDPVLMMQLEFGMANQFIKDLSVDVKRGMRKKAERGWYPASSLPIGYKHNKNPEGHIVHGEEIVIDEETFTLVRSLWKKMLKGNHSIASIKREGDKIGLKSRKGRILSHSNYVRLFSNYFYCGYFNWNDGSGNQTMHKGKHMPMITEAEFDQVQRLMGARSRPTRNNRCHYTFRGPMHCGECGCAITAERKLRVTCTNCKYRFSLLRCNECPKCGLDFSKMKNPTVLWI